MLTPTDFPLIDEALQPDPAAEAEMGANNSELISDQDLKGCRLLVVRRAVEAIKIDEHPGGAIELACTFQASIGTRFTSARLIMQLTTPVGIRIVSLAPHEVREKEPVKFTIDRKGALSLKYLPIETGAESGRSQEYSIYHCVVSGSGEATALARWEFAENPQRRDGLIHEQALALTLPGTGTVTGTISVAARLTRSGIGGQVAAVRDLILGYGKERRYPISFDIPPLTHTPPLWRFLLGS